MTTAPQTDAIGVGEFYARIFRDAIDAARAGVYMQLTVFGDDARTALDRVTEEVGLPPTAAEGVPSPSDPHEIMVIARLTMANAATITVHLASRWV